VCLKHIERSLSSTWVNQKKMVVWRLSTPHTDPRLGKWKAATARLRSAMLTFIQHLLYYSTVEVLDRNYKSFAASIESSESVDHLIVEHGQFLYTCMTDMMITHLDLLTVQDKLFQDCRNFVSLMDRANTWMSLIDEKALPAADRVGAQRPRGRSGQEYTNDELMSLLEQRLEALSEKFARHMHNFIETINDSASQESTIRLIIGARLEMLFTNAQP
jgi:gamma-tubulin complex component 2